MIIFIQTSNATHAYNSFKTQGDTSLFAYHSPISTSGFIHFCPTDALLSLDFYRKAETTFSLKTMTCPSLSTWTSLKSRAKEVAGRFSKWVRTWWHVDLSLVMASAKNLVRVRWKTETSINCQFICKIDTTEMCKRTGINSPFVARSSAKMIRVYRNIAPKNGPGSWERWVGE